MSGPQRTVVFEGHCFELQFVAEFQAVLALHRSGSWVSLARHEPCRGSWFRRLDRSTGQEKKARVRHMSQEKGKHESGKSKARVRKKQGTSQENAKHESGKSGTSQEKARHESGKSGTSQEKAP